MTVWVATDLLAFTMAEDENAVKKSGGHRLSRHG